MTVLFTNHLTRLQLQICQRGSVQLDFHTGTVFGLCGILPFWFFRSLSLLTSNFAGNHFSGKRKVRSLTSPIICSYYLSGGFPSVPSLTVVFSSGHFPPGRAWGNQLEPCVGTQLVFAFLVYYCARLSSFHWFVT